VSGGKEGGAEGVLRESRAGAPGRVLRLAVALSLSAADAIWLFVAGRSAGRRPVSVSRCRRELSVILTRRRCPCCVLRVYFFVVVDVS